MKSRGRQYMSLWRKVRLPKHEQIRSWSESFCGTLWFRSCHSGIILEAKLWGSIFWASSLPELSNLSTTFTSTSGVVDYFCLLTKRECWLLTQPLLASEISNMIQRFSPLKSHWFNMAQIGNDLKLCWPDSCLEAHLKWTISQVASRQGTCCYCGLQNVISAGILVAARLNVESSTRRLK